MCLFMIDQRKVVNVSEIYSKLDELLSNVGSKYVVSNEGADYKEKRLRYKGSTGKRIRRQFVTIVKFALSFCYP